MAEVLPEHRGHGIVAVVVALVRRLDPTRAPDMVVLFASHLRRGAGAGNEYYKTFLREQDQTKYSIPMQFSIGGRWSEPGRLPDGRGRLPGAGSSLTVYGVHYLQASGSGDRDGWWCSRWEASGGWISAFGGAWKDAPIEGFRDPQVLPEPGVRPHLGVHAGQPDRQHLFVGFGALGFTVATIETYKTFFYPSKPRGKFAGMQIRYPEWLHRRRHFVPLYVAIWAALLATIVVAFLSPHRGLV